MSLQETMTTGDQADTMFGQSYDRLQAVDSVIILIANFVDDGSNPVVDIPEKRQMELAYVQCRKATQKRFDRSCDDLARIARAGAQALLQLKSEGRHNLGAAANKLINEIDRIKRQSLAMLRL